MNRPVIGAELLRHGLNGRQLAARDPFAGNDLASQVLRDLGMSRLIPFDLKFREQKI